eukprot:scaffold5824_cov373-Prasinococcus_capsulatus_cf.AAC.2
MRPMPIKHRQGIMNPSVCANFLAWVTVMRFDEIKPSTAAPATVAIMNEATEGTIAIMAAALNGRDIQELNRDGSQASRA